VDNYITPPPAPRPFTLRHVADIEPPTITYPSPAPVASISHPFVNLQLAYDRQFRGHYQYHQHTLARQLQTNDYNVDLPQGRVKIFKDHRPNSITWHEKLNYSTPTRTYQPLERPHVQRQLLTAVAKRNFNTSDHTLPNDYLVFAEQVVEKGFDTYCIANWREVCRTYRADPVTVSLETIDSYFIDNSLAKLHSLVNPTYSQHPTTNSITTDDFHQFDIAIKAAPKSKLDDSASSEYFGLQTIVSNSKKINAIMSCYREMFSRFQNILKPKVFVQLKKSIQQLENHLNRFLKPNSRSLEIDMSKFDKSQLVTSFLVEMKTWETLGLDANLSKLWFQGLTFSEIRSAVLYAKFYWSYQRRSGTVTTACGNTVINMLSNAWCLDLQDDFDCAYFIGDDSIIFRDNWPSLVHAAEMHADLFNFQVKLIKSHAPYFCSGFIIHDGWSVHYIPDPYKRAEKLSEPKHFQNIDEETAELHVSFSDLCHGYDNASIKACLQFCTTVRYGNSCSTISDTITTLLHSPREFRKAYTLLDFLRC